MMRIRLVAVACAVTAAIALAAPAAAATGVKVDASIGGRPVRGVQDRRAVELRPSATTQLTVRVTNASTTSVRVRGVRLQGRTLGFVLFGYVATTDFIVPAQGSAVGTVTLDTSDLGSQVTGLLPTAVSVLDARHHTIAAVRFPVDVRGHPLSTWSWFAVVLALLSLAAIAAVAYAVARQRLPGNRLARAVRFLAPGIATGLTVVVGTSVLRLASPRPALWVPLLVITTGAFFVLGYLTPTPDFAGMEQVEAIEYQMAPLGQP